MTNYQPGMTLEQVEKNAILEAYKFYQKNKPQTAMSLGISLRTLYNRLHTYGVISDDCLPVEERIPVQPACEVPAQSSVLLPEREEIQKVLPGRHTPRRNR